MENPTVQDIFPVSYTHLDVYKRQGIEGVVLSCGMNNAHSVNEYIELEDLIKGAELVGALISQE